MRFGGPCICGKARRGESLVSEGICHWCGRGVPIAPMCGHRLPRLRRLPRDLGVFQREGRRLDPNFDNVVRLDRLRRYWAVPRVAPEGPTATATATVDELTDRQLEVMELVGDGFSDADVAERLGVAVSTVGVHMCHIRQVIGVHRRADALAWWHSQQVRSRERAA